MLITLSIFGIPSAHGGPIDAKSALAVLKVEEESVRVGYEREMFNHWIDADSDGCDTRREVLLDEAVIKPTITGSCDLIGGQWLSKYDGLVLTEASELDVDHVVSLAEAWDSGASKWDAPTREAFANDLQSSNSLIAVSASSNRSKSDSDTSEWSPSNRSGVCWLTSATVVTKHRWSLSIDKKEKAALSTLIARCGIKKITLAPKAKIALTAIPAKPGSTGIPTPPPAPATNPSSAPQPATTAQPSPSTPTVTPAPASTPVASTPSTTPIGGNCPSSHPVKGNINGSSRIYHTISSSYYSRTDAEVCFLDERSAVAAGFRAPLKG